MTKDEALKLALEALEEAHYKVEHKQDAAKREQAITAIKEALAQTSTQCEKQPAQEPFPWVDEAAIRADEREACAKVCDEVGEHPSLTPRHCAEGIRARGNT